MGFSLPSYKGDQYLLLPKLPKNFDKHVLKCHVNYYSGLRVISFRIVKMTEQGCEAEGSPYARKWEEGNDVALPR